MPVWSLMISPDCSADEGSIGNEDAPNDSASGSAESAGVGPSAGSPINTEEGSAKTGSGSSKFANLNDPAFSGMASPTISGISSW
jgi:hypothetical protein